MGLETGTLIPNFNSAWPLGTDDVSQGDDHIRLIKSILQNALPGNTAPLQFTGFDLHIINDAGGTGLGGDGFFKDIDCEIANINQEIQACPQVAIAVGILDGTTAALKGNQFGTVGVVRTSGEPVGSYDVTLVESPGADVVGGGSSGFVNLFMNYTTNVIATATPNVVRVQVHNVGNGALVDVDNVTFFVFDSGRA